MSCCWVLIIDPGSLCTSNSNTQTKIYDLSFLSWPVPMLYHYSCVYIYSSLSMYVYRTIRIYVWIYVNVQQDTGCTASAALHDRTMAVFHLCCQRFGWDYVDAYDTSSC